MKRNSSSLWTRVRAIGARSCGRRHGLWRVFRRVERRSLPGEKGLMIPVSFANSTCRSPRYSVLPAISLNGMLHCTIREGSFDTASFTAFISDLLDHMQPWPTLNSVVVMDNCKIHKSPEIRKLIESRFVYSTLSSSCASALTNLTRGMKLEFLPAYSPDFNPIELAFSYLKYRLRRVGYNSMEGEDSLLVLLYGETMSVSAADCRAFYHHCGYDC